MPILEVGDVAINYLEEGSGRPVVFLHTGPGQARDWRRVVGAMPEGHRCLALDMYGAGETSPWHGRRPLEIDDQARLVVSLAEAACPPVAVVGHSYGGAVALRLAIARPDLVASMVLVEPQIYPLLSEVGDQAFEISFGVFRQFRSAVERGEPAAGWRSFIDFFSSAGFWDSLPGDVRQRFVAISEFCVESYGALFDSPTSMEDLRTIRVPTLVVQGELTTVPERRMCEIVVESVPEAKLALVSGAGHMSPMTHPTQVAAMLAADLSD